MRGMRLVPQRIQKQNVESFELMHGRIGDLAVIGEISGRSEAIAVDLALAVDENHRFEAGTENLYRPINGPQFEKRQAAEFVIRIENVAEHFAQKSSGFRARVERQLVRLVAIAQGAEIVDAENVIRMSVGVEHRIYLRDLLPNGLSVEIRSGINQHYFAAVFD